MTRKQMRIFMRKSICHMSRTPLITLVSRPDYVRETSSRPHNSPPGLSSRSADGLLFMPLCIELMSMVSSVEEKLRRAKIDQVKSQQAIRRSKNLTLGSKQKIAKLEESKTGRKAAKATLTEASRKSALDDAAEVRRRAREVREKSKQIHSKSKQVREALSSHNGNSRA